MDEFSSKTVSEISQNLPIRVKKFHNYCTSSIFEVFVKQCHFWHQKLDLVFVLFLNLNTVYFILDSWIRFFISYKLYVSNQSSSDKSFLLTPVFKAFQLNYSIRRFETSWHNIYILDFLTSISDLDRTSVRVASAYGSILTWYAFTVEDSKKTRLLRFRSNFRRGLLREKYIFRSKNIFKLRSFLIFSALKSNETTGSFYIFCEFEWSKWPIMRKYIKK